MCYLKALGLALMAGFVMSAVVASAASAQNQGVFTSETGEPFTLTVEETGESGTGANGLTSFGERVECPGTIYTGHKAQETPHKFLSNGATEVTITPHYAQESCETGGGFTMTIETTGCDFRYYGAQTSGEVFGTYAVTADLICPEEATGIHVKVYTGEHTGTPVCSLTMAPQTGLEGAHLTSSEGDVLVTGAFEGVHFARSGFCLLDGKGGTDATGKFDIDATIKAHNELGEPVGLKVSDACS